nr:hypothetical protein [Glaciibacter flavus]
MPGDDQFPRPDESGTAIEGAHALRVGGGGIVRRLDLLDRLEQVL